MSHSFDHEELGIDLDRVAALPECQACRKKSDGCVKVKDTILCGKDYDEWLSMNRKRGKNPLVSAADFAASLRAGRYRACWEATLNE